MKTILNHVQRFKSFVYERTRWKQTMTGELCLVVTVIARANGQAICSGCEKARSGYDRLKARRYEFIPVWNIPVFFEYAPRRVNCRDCGVRVEKLPWAAGKRTLTTTYMQFLAHWSWKETAISFRTTWDKVYQAVEYIVEWGLKHRQIGPIFAMGVDEIQYARGHKYLTLVYQIDDLTRLLWVGQERTVSYRFLLAFVPVITTATAALVAWMESNRIGSLVALYQDTATQLRLLIAEWRDAEVELSEQPERRRMKEARFVAKAEEIMARENGSWRAEWLSRERAKLVLAAQEKVMSEAPKANSMKR